jgi:hypothetical protein
MSHEGENGMNERDGGEYTNNKFCRNRGAVERMQTGARFWRPSERRVIRVDILHGNRKRNTQSFSGYRFGFKFD